MNRSLTLADFVMCRDFIDCSKRKWDVRHVSIEVKNLRLIESYEIKIRKKPFERENMK